MAMAMAGATGRGGPALALLLLAGMAACAPDRRAAATGAAEEGSAPAAPAAPAAQLPAGDAVPRLARLRDSREGDAAARLSRAGPHASLPRRPLPVILLRQGGNSL
jgi:hypothetical protein